MQWERERQKSSKKHRPRIFYPELFINCLRYVEKSVTSNGHYHWVETLQSFFIGTKFNRYTPGIDILLVRVIHSNAFNVIKLINITLNWLDSDLMLHSFGFNTMSIHKNCDLLYSTSLSSIHLSLISAFKPYASLI